MSLNNSQCSPSDQRKENNVEDVGNLQLKLATLGYYDRVPIAATALVTTLVNDLLRTTESFKSAKDEIADLLEQKKIWELGTEPFKCESTRLLTECNILNTQMLYDREDFELKLCELSLQLKRINAENRSLLEKVASLTSQLKHQHIDTSKIKTKDKWSKPPFITAVRCEISQLKSAPGICSKDIGEQHGSSSAYANVSSSTAGNQGICDHEELETRLERSINMVKSRDREIQRLQELLSKDGRPVSALFKECCYKDVQSLKDDVRSLQSEKTKLSIKAIETESKLHDAMKRAHSAANSNKTLKMELEKMREVALDVENEANSLIENYERDINKLRKELNKFEDNQKNLDNIPTCSKNIRKQIDCNDDIAKIKDNILDYKKYEILHQKVHKLKSQLKLMEIQTGMTKVQMQEDKTVEQANNHLTLENELKALKALCSQYRHDYMHHVATEKENENLKIYLKSKEEQIENLQKRIGLFDRNNIQAAVDSIGNTEQPVNINENSTNINGPRAGAGDGESISVQVTLRRLNIERDVAVAEVKRLEQYIKDCQERSMKSEQDNTAKIFELNEQLEFLKSNMTTVEAKNRYWLDVTKPCFNQIAIIKEECKELHQKCLAYEKTIKKLDDENKQLRNLSRITTLSLEKCMPSYNGNGNTPENISKLKADIQRLTALNINLQHKCHEFDNLAKEHAKLKDQYVLMCDENHAKVEDIQNKLVKSTDYIDQLLLQLQEQQYETSGYAAKYQESKKEIERLTNQVTKYMEEVKKVQELLNAKEKERSEMLDFYRDLSNEQCALESNKHSLEIDAEHYKEHIEDLCEQNSKCKEENEKLKDVVNQLQNKIQIYEVEDEDLKHELSMAKENEELVQKDLLTQQEKYKKVHEKYCIVKDRCESMNKKWNSVTDLFHQKMAESLKVQSSDMVPSTNFLQKALSDTRKELQVLMLADGKLCQENERFKKENLKLREIINLEKTLRSRAEDLLLQSNDTCNEIFKKMIDYRFCAARRREHTTQNNGHSNITESSEIT